MLQLSWCITCIQAFLSNQSCAASAPGGEQINWVFIASGRYQLRGCFCHMPLQLVIQEMLKWGLDIPKMYNVYYCFFLLFWRKLNWTHSKTHCNYFTSFCHFDRPTVTPFWLKRERNFKSSCLTIKANVFYNIGRIIKYLLNLDTLPYLWQGKRKVKTTKCLNLVESELSSATDACVLGQLAKQFSISF